MTIEYIDYNDRKFLVYLDKETHEKCMRQIGGRWNGRAKPKVGWLIPKENEHLLKNVIENITNKIIIKPRSRSHQYQYHRAVSITIDDSDEEDVAPPKSPPKGYEDLVNYAKSVDNSPNPDNSTYTRTLPDISHSSPLPKRETFMDLSKSILSLEERLKNYDIKAEK